MRRFNLRQVSSVFQMALPTDAGVEVKPEPLLKPGFSLMELLIVIAVSTVVAAVAFTVYRLNVESYLKEDARLEKDQNLRVALFSIARDVRMAGNGFVLMNPQTQLVQVYVPSMETIDSGGKSEMVVSDGWFWHADAEQSNEDERGARAVFGVDGGANRPDTLTVFRAEVESASPIAQVGSSGYSPGTDGGTITLQGSFPDDTVRNKDIIALVSGRQIALMEVSASGKADGEMLDSAASLPVKLGGRFTAPAAAALDFDSGSNIYNLRDVVFVTYYVDESTNSLMADYHDVSMTSPDNSSKGTVVVANNIEDMQVFYYFTDPVVDDVVTMDSVDQDPGINSAVLDARRVKAVAIGLVARSPNDDAQSAIYKRPALFNRIEGTAADAHPRSVMTEIVFLRN